MIVFGLFFSFSGRPNSALDPRPYSGRYLGRSSSPRFSQNSVGPLNRLRTESGSSSERSPSSAKIPSVEVHVGREHSDFNLITLSTPKI